MPKKKIILTGGGTGGHVYPLVEIAKSLSNDFELIYVGLGDDFEKKAFRSIKLVHKPITAGKLRRNASISNFAANVVDIFKIIAGIFQSVYLIVSQKPSLVFSKGGYVALPVCIAAAITGTKLIVHESDSVFGLTNRIAAKFAKRVLVGFPVEAYPAKYAKRAVRVGIPIKQGFFATGKSVVTNSILVIGGSSGAVSLNQMIFSVGEKLLKKYKIVHIVGENNLRTALEFREGLDSDQSKKYTPIAYSNEVDELIKKSNLVISRSGATAIFEAMAANKPLVLVPISPNVAFHQTINALYCEYIGAAKIVLQSDDGTKLFSTIDKLLSDDSQNQTVHLAVKDSAKKIKQIIDDELDNRLDRYSHIHLIGSGGVSMKAIGKVLNNLGKKVTGSDLKFGGHSRDNITRDVDLVVYSSAAGASSPAKGEHDQAHRLNIDIIKRSKMIAMIGQNKSVISVAGMHGKTTTSSIVSQIFSFAGYDPSYLIGAESTRSNPTANYSVRGEHLVLEACEYDGSFLDFCSEAAIVTNIELEHLDYFKQGMKSILAAFGAFISNIRDGGILIYCADDDNLKKLVGKYRHQLADRSVNLISYGRDKSADFVLSRVGFDKGSSKFSVKNKKSTIEIQSPIPGDHFALNCAGAIALSKSFGIPDVFIQATIATFMGADRRFSFVGAWANVEVYDDYAHHPTEISSTLRALTEANDDKKIIVVFQPHQQKRFDDFYNNFLNVFAESKADLIVLLPVYKIVGRDTVELRSSEDLVRDLAARGKQVIYAGDYRTAEKFVVEKCKGEKFVVMTMGATDVYKIAKKILEDVKIEKRFTNSI